MPHRERERRYRVRSREDAHLERSEVGESPSRVGDPRHAQEPVKTVRKRARRAAVPLPSDHPRHDGSEPRHKRPQPVAADRPRERHDRGTDARQKRPRLSLHWPAAASDGVVMNAGLTSRDAEELTGRRPPAARPADEPGTTHRGETDRETYDPTWSPVRKLYRNVPQRDA